MGKIIEFKKFSKKINTDNLSTQNFSMDIFPENDLMYIRKEIELNLDEIDSILNCVYKQILINEKLINSDEYDFEKLTYLRDFNDKLQDIMYFLTNSPYNNPIIININFLELKYLMGSLQLELEVLRESEAISQSSSYTKMIECFFNRLLPIYSSWKKEIYKI